MYKRRENKKRLLGGAEQSVCYLANNKILKYTWCDKKKNNQINMQTDKQAIRFTREMVNG